MKKFSLNLDSFFKVIHTTKESQVAEMVLSPKSSTGGPQNNHPTSNQWLYVISGSGKAVINNDNISFKKGDLLLIESGENHEIVNTGDVDLKTLNIYSPPEY